VLLVFLTTMEDTTDAPQCWKTESILVYGGEGHAPIDIAPFLVDEQDGNASLMRLRKRLEFPADVYPPSWENRKKIEDAVKNAVAKVDNINLNVYATDPQAKCAKFPSTTLACDMARSYRPPKNPDEIQASVYANKDNLPRLDKPGVRQDLMTHKKNANRTNGKTKPKRTTTEKPPPDERCTFRIRISLDPGNCWFLPPWAGCRCHKFHSKHSPSEKRRRMDTLTEKERDDAAIFTRQGSAGVATGILKEQTGNTMSASQLKYNKDKNEIKTGHVPKPAPGDIPGVGSTAEQCIRYLEKEMQEGKKSYIALYHSVQLTTLLTIKKKREAKARKPKKDKRTAGPPAAHDNQEDQESEPTEQERTAGPLPTPGDNQEDQESEPTEQARAGMVMEVE
jgi:hypothetical protein